MSIQVGGVSNFRSVGGFVGWEGRRIRPHALLRSDRLSGLSARDWAVLCGIGLHTVCDLRSDSERERAPNCTPPAIRELRFDVRNDIRADAGMLAAVVGDPTREGAARAMISMYSRFPVVLAPPLGQIIRALSNGCFPMLVHCEVGKDRTGFVIAVLLTVLGVPRSEVFADYTRSDGWPGTAAQKTPLRVLLGHQTDECQLDECMNTLLAAREEYLAAALGAIERQYGTVESYLCNSSGLDMPELTSLRRKLMTDTQP